MIDLCDNQQGVARGGLERLLMGTLEDLGADSHGEAADVVEVINGVARFLFLGGESDFEKVLLYTAWALWSTGCRHTADDLLRERLGLRREVERHFLLGGGLDGLGLRLKLLKNGVLLFDRERAWAAGERMVGLALGKISGLSDGGLEMAGVMTAARVLQMAAPAWDEYGGRGCLLLKGESVVGVEDCRGILSALQVRRRWSECPRVVAMQG